jgi:hypothetical protein
MYAVTSLYDAVTMSFNKAAKQDASAFPSTTENLAGKTSFQNKKNESSRQIKLCMQSRACLALDESPSSGA